MNGMPASVVWLGGDALDISVSVFHRPVGVRMVAVDNTPWCEIGQCRLF